MRASAITADPVLCDARQQVAAAAFGSHFFQDFLDPASDPMNSVRWDRQ